MWLVSMKENITLITPKRGLSTSFREMWEFRELLGVFFWRDLKVRYKQTVLGVLWVVLQPVVSTLVFTIFFGKLAKIPSDGMPYSLFVLSGLVYWNYFASSLAKISESIVGNEGVIKKIYFPRIILPISALLTSVVDFLIGVIVLITFAFVIGYPPGWAAIYIFPLALVFSALSALGVGLIFASINVVYRDVRYAIPFITQLLVFLTPVIYPLSIVAPNNRILMAINPMTSTINLVRSVFPSTNTSANVGLVAISVSVAIIFLFLGLLYFKRIEKLFADIT